MYTLSLRILLTGLITVSLLIAPMAPLNGSGTAILSAPDNLAADSVTLGLFDWMRRGQQGAIALYNDFFSSPSVLAAGGVPDLDLDTTDTTPVTTAALDNFDSNGYSGGSGWSSNWTETGDNGSSGSGDIEIVGGGLFGGGDLSLEFTMDEGVRSIRRSIDLSGASSATLGLSFSHNFNDPDEYIEASSDGTTFTQLRRFDQSDTTGLQSYSFDISAYASATTAIRFISSDPDIDPGGFLGIGAETPSTATFDEISIVKQDTPPFTYTDSYTVNDPTLAVTDATADIDDTDSSNMSGATITLTNPEAGDALAISGSVVAGGSSGTVSGTSIGYSVSGDGYTITLSGSDSTVNYETAIRAIGFSSSSTTLTDRLIDLQVTDDTAQASNTARTTMKMLPEPPDTDGDNATLLADISCT